jgi:hypothetical protein
MVRQTGAPGSFEAIFGFRLPDAREREALGILLSYLRRAERDLGRQRAELTWDGRGGCGGSGGERAMATDAALRTTMREAICRVAAFCDGLLEAVDLSPAVAPGHPPDRAGVGRPR